MSETKHTPGPWHVGEVAILDRDTGQERPDPHSAWVHNDGSFEVSLISSDASADARLIAAAPDMLEALIDLVKEASEYYEGGKLGAARAAVAKATGETP